jgi:hypothetical protein
MVIGVAISINIYGHFTNVPGKPLFFFSNMVDDLLMIKPACRTDRDRLISVVVRMVPLN